MHYDKQYCIYVKLVPTTLDIINPEPVDCACYGWELWWCGENHASKTKDINDISLGIFQWRWKLCYISPHSVYQDENFDLIIIVSHSNSAL